MPTERGDGVGGLEADPPHVGGQPVRLAAHDGDRRVAVFLVDPHRQRGGHPDALQEDHHFLDGLLLGPGGGDHRGALGAQAVDLDQPARLVVDDVHDVHAEVRDHAFGHDRADALDQARAQVFLDARGGGGQHRGVGVHLELPAVLRVADDQRPRSRRNSPICAPSSGPTAVISSAPPRSGAIRAIVYPVSGLAKVTRSRTPSRTAPPPGPATIAGMKTIFHPDTPAGTGVRNLTSHSARAASQSSHGMAEVTDSAQADDAGVVTDPLSLAHLGS